jgi:glycosyltransferase involved in cell wall biosynthesis
VRVVGIARVRNEQDLILYVVTHMLRECDAVIVADNNSTDGTKRYLEILASQTDCLTILDEPSFAFNQTITMNWLAEMAEADWVVPFDADEWWDSPTGRLRDVLPLVDGYQTLTTTWDMIPQPSDTGRIPFERIVWTRPGSLWAGHPKVAFMPGQGRRLQEGNHGLVGMPNAPVGPLRIRHYPFRTKEQAIAKLRHGRNAIIATGSDASIGSHWREWGSMTDEQFDVWWAEWTKPEGLVQWT